MIRLILIIILAASPALALELTYQTDNSGLILMDDAGLGLIDENGIPPVAASVTRLFPRTAEGFINPIPPGTEFDVCDAAPLMPPTYTSSTPFLYANDPAWNIPFWVVAGKPWKTKLELIRYDEGNTDYQGFTFETVFLSTGPAPLPLQVMTKVVETIVNGVTTTTQTDSPFYHLQQPLPFYIPPGYTWPLRSDWKIYYDPCSDPERMQYGLEMCRYRYGIFPGAVTGDDTNGTKTYVFLRTEYYDVAPYYNNEIPVTATVTATPGYLEISMDAAQTAEMANWSGALRLSVLYPEFVDNPDPYADPVIGSYSKNPLNPLPMLVTP